MAHIISPTFTVRRPLFTEQMQTGARKARQLLLPLFSYCYFHSSATASTLHAHHPLLYTHTMVSNPLPPAPLKWVSCTSATRTTRRPRLPSPKPSNVSERNEKNSLLASGRVALLKQLAKHIIDG